MDENYKQLYFELLNEYRRLQSELKSIKKLLAFIPANIQSSEIMPIMLPEKTHDEPIITMHSDRQQQITLFMSLFRGRKDLYAKRYYNKKTKKAGYAPVCLNEWKPDICNKSQLKCKDCPKRMFRRLSSSIVEAHLYGKHPFGEDVIGIYPLTKDECCYFLAVDFDKEHWQADVTAFKETCQEKGLPVYIERSRSGQGAHAWIFFTEKISARSARKLGNALLTHTMNKHHGLRLTSYDRLFPSGEQLPKGGFGNLIALPLQGAAVRHGNSLFVDDDFEPYPDQWMFLANVDKLTPNQVHVFSERLCEQGEFGDLMEASQEVKPWEKKILPSSLEKNDFPEKLNLVYANRVYIEKRNTSARALNRIKRLAAFRNPEFYKFQSLRLPTYNKPRIIDCSKEFKDYLSIPRGCLEELVALLKEAGASYEIQDKRFAGNKILIDFKGELREEQALAAKALLAHDIGVLSATTAFGKTVIAAQLIATRKVNTLILVHTSALMEQWKQSLERFLYFHEALPDPPKKRGRKNEQSHIGQLGSGKNTLKGKVDLAIIHSLSTKDEVKDLVCDYGMVIVDECHHVSAVSFERILVKANAKYVYGLTATPKRRDGHHPIIFMQCGPIRYHVDAKAQAKKRDFEHFIVPRFTNFKVPESSDLNITAIYGALVENEARNLRIIQDVSNSLEAGRTPIILTQRTSHVKLLKTALSKMGFNIITLTGAASSKKKREALAYLNSLSAQDTFALIATGKYVGEGFDCPRLDTLFLAMPVSWKGTLHQYAGRLHREYQGKKDVIIYDYVDIHVKMLENMYHKRVQGYAGLGYQAKYDGEASEKLGVLFDQQNFLLFLKSDLEKARSKVVIVSPFVRRSRVKSMISLLSNLNLDRAQITIVTRPPSDYKLAEQERITELLASLKSAKMTLILRPAIHQKFIIIDGQIVWYGSINLLSYGHSEESMMRLVNQEIANELLEICF